MYQRKEKAENCYYPTFLCMDIDAPDDVLDICHVPKDLRTEAAFLHEYIHYLQDVTTLSGYARIGTIVDQMKWAINDAKGKLKLKIPYDTTSTYSYNIYPNAQCMQLSAGRFAFRNTDGTRIKTDIKKILNFFVHRRYIKIPNRRDQFSFDETILMFEDQNGIERSFEVGEYAISESMSYMIEQSVYPDVLPLNNDCPYMVVDRIVAHECPQAHNRLTMIAICDVCLNYTFPGEILYHLLQKLKSEPIISPALVYIMWKGGILKDIRNYRNSWDIDASEAHDNAISQINAYFLHEYWGDTRDAALASLDAGWYLRQNKPTLFLDIASGGSLCLNKAFKKALSLCGCMCVKTSDNNVRYMPPFCALNKVVKADTFECLLELYQILLTDKVVKTTRIGKVLAYECSLKEWCSNSFRQLGVVDITTTTMNCIESPWANCDPNYRTHCELGRLWYAYKLGKPKLRK